MMPYEPEPGEVMVWVTTGGARWPAGDWDYYVMNGKNDELVLRLAIEDPGAKDGFFIHCLYYLVGNYVSGSMGDRTKRERIDALLHRIGTRSSAEVELWRDQTQAVIEGRAKIDPTEWTEWNFR